MKRHELFYKLIEILDQNSIPYALVGRTEDYPAHIGSDIDIVIPRDEINNFHKSIWQIQDDDTLIVQMIQHEIVAFYYVVYHFDINERIYLQPDVCTDYYRKGRKLLSADYLLEGRREAVQGGFYILAPEKEFLYYLIKKIDKRKLSEQQFQHIRNSYLVNKLEALNQASLFWKESELSIIEESLDKNDYQMMCNHILQLQKGIHTSHKRKITDSLDNVLLKVNRILLPTGFVMTIMGPDGSGKTTVINELRADIEPAFRRIQQFHLFPIPQTEENAVEQNPQGIKKRGFILSLLKLFYLLWVYTKGHLLYVMPKNIRSTLTIYDRFFDDLLVDPLRYRNGTPSWVVKAFRCMIKEPELWLFLDCPTDVIQARKSEVPYEETERQRKAYIKLAQSKKKCLVLNTNRDINNISLDACRFVCKALNQRAIRRYKR